MLKLCQFHLQLTFMAAGSLPEDIENQPGSVNYPNLQCILKVALLGRGQGMIENDGVGTKFDYRITNLANFS